MPAVPIFLAASSPPCPNHHDHGILGAGLLTAPDDSARMVPGNAEGTSPSPVEHADIARISYPLSTLGEGGASGSGEGLSRFLKSNRFAISRDRHRVARVKFHQPARNERARFETVV